MQTKRHVEIADALDWFAQVKPVSVDFIARSFSASEILGQACAQLLAAVRLIQNRLPMIC